MLSSQTEMPMKSILRIEVDASELKIGIKPFLRFPVLRIELVDVVVIQVEWLSVLFLVLVSSMVCPLWVG